ncbi:MAG: hypothetical protein NTV87_00115 [Ignavibacteriae bacterium]|nr:hypothetical protein [Ignavibacteriota bacterium]
MKYLKIKIFCIILMSFFIIVNSSNAEWIVGDLKNVGNWSNINGQWYLASVSPSLYEGWLTGWGQIWYVDTVSVTTLLEGNYYYFMGSVSSWGGGDIGSIFYLVDQDGVVLRNLSMGGVYFQANAEDVKAVRLVSMGHGTAGGFDDDHIYLVVSVMAGLYDAQLLNDYWKIVSLFMGMICGLSFVMGIKSVGF